jgi:hypothetical protein
MMAGKSIAGAAGMPKAWDGNCHFGRAPRHGR